MLPEIHEKIPKVNTIMEDDPAANPSSPSVKFVPLESATTVSYTHLRAHETN